jgi:penicillin amidase
MGKLWYIMGAILVLLLAFSGLFAGGGYLVLHRRYPLYDGVVMAPGLGAEVQIYRDRWGVPYIYAQNANDLFGAQGYVHAQDRLWQMDFQRRAGHGRLAEVLGESALASDRFFRTLGLGRAAAREWVLLDETTRAALQAYAAGVNAFLQDHRDRLPIEFTLLDFEPEPWEPLDSLVWGKMMAWSQGFNWSVELLHARLIATLGQARAAELAPLCADDVSLALLPEVAGYASLAHTTLPNLPCGEPGLGSSGWVVDGTLTANGHPLLANDLYLPVGLPAWWYEIGLHGGGYEVAGFSLPGMPGVIVGHNAHIAWGLTNALADTQDLYLERLNPVDPRQYEYRGEWLEIKVIREEIAIKDRPEPMVLQVRLTHHGPLLNDVVDGLETPISLRWTGFDSSSLFPAVLGLNQSGDWASFRAALADWTAVPQNLAYADTKGNIGYQLAGGIPIRAQGQGSVPVPGWTGEYEWIGQVPFDKLPYALNPPAHYVVTDNSGIASNDDATFFPAQWDAPSHTRRIADLIRISDRHTLASFRTIQADVYALMAEPLMPHLLALEPQGWLQERVTRDLMRDWDYRLTPESGAAAVFEVFYRQLIKAVWADELGTALFHEYLRYGNAHRQAMERILSDVDNSWFDDVTTPAREMRDDILRRAFAAALDELGRHYGDLHTNWHWGDLHGVTFVHQPLGENGVVPLEWLVNRGPYPVGGSLFTINAEAFSFTAPFDVVYGPTGRQIVDLGDWNNSQSQVSPGQSGHPFHRHYDDQIRPWISVEPHPMPWTREVVEKAHVALLVLQPLPHIAHESEIVV